MCNRIQINEEQPFTRGAFVQLSVGVRQWNGFAKSETLDKKFPEFYGWKETTINSANFTSTSYTDDVGYSATRVNLPEPQCMCVIYNGDEFRVITREANNNELRLIGKERVPLVRDNWGEIVYFNRHHTYKRVDWR